MAESTFTQDEWKTITALRGMPFGSVHNAAANALEYALAERTGDSLIDVNFSDESLLWIDQLVRSGQFATRGCVIKDAIRSFIEENKSITEKEAE